MTARDETHILNPLPYEVPRVGKEPFRTNSFLYVISRADAMRFLLATAHGLQDGGWPFPALQARRETCDAWWNLFFDLDPRDQVAVGRGLKQQGIDLPDDPQAR